MFKLHLPPRLTHHRLNNWLTVLVVVFGLYIMAAPFLPQISWWLNPPKLPATPAVMTKVPKPNTPIPAENLLIIPRLGMKEVINTGPTIAELRKGVWLVPKTSQPDLKSNTVIVGHRFTYAGPAIFYFLDKIEVGDRITIDWHHKEYTYKVTAVTIVPPTDLAVQGPSATPVLTLYTCTPLWSAANRLVITAPLQGVRS